jgi:peptidoglycan/xylan/chitin deacetylase (PgdA/CDA1 family)
VTPKELLFSLAQRAGLLTWLRDSRWRRERLLILCYHGVALLDEHEWNPELYVTRELLRDRLRYLRDAGYSILPLREACERLTLGTLPPRSVSLTFDDGTVDFSRLVVPLLEEFSVPATIYLTTYYSDLRIPVFDTVLSYVLWKGRTSKADLGSLCDSPVPVRVSTAAARDHARGALWEHATKLGLDAHAKNSFVARIADRLQVPYDRVLESRVLQIMSPDEVAALPRDLVDVQLHTHRHRTPPTRELFVRELRDNADRVRALRGASASLTHFCYPSGVYDGAFLPWLRESGIEYATTCVPGIAAVGDDSLLLPRFIDSGAHSTATFEAWASGFAAWLPKRRAHRLDRSLLRPTAAPPRTAGPPLA